VREPESFPRLDPVGPAEVGLPDDALSVLEDTVASQAAEADRHGVQRAVIDALADAGLLGTALVPAALQRELSEQLAGVDGSTWFCWVQHQTPLRTLEGDIVGLRSGAAEQLRQRLLPGMRSGRLLGAVAFAHVRRPGRANPEATRVPGGWRLDGTLDWVTSWDIADVVMVMAQGAGEHRDSLVCCYLPGGNTGALTAGLTADVPLELLAMGGTHTRPVRLDAVFVPDESVGAIVDRGEWLAADAVRSADANPAAFGVARGAIAELTSLARRRDDGRLHRAAETLTAQCVEVRTRAYRVSADGGEVSQRLDLRARALDLAGRASSAVVVARAGAAMLAGASAERRVRESLFLQVQAQTRASRDATLDLLVDGRRAPSGPSDGP
jgi:alkylation response protein AidB-like acyl-CoA dehydrogenase